MLNKIMKKVACAILVAVVAVSGVTGVSASNCKAATTSNVYSVNVSKGYLALRSSKAYTNKNEIGKLYKGESVVVKSYGSGDYWYVYSTKLKKTGFVNKNYLKGKTANTKQTSIRTVRVKSGYLALRKAMAFNSKNEIGKLYTGNKVQVIKSYGSYTYVYAPTLGKYGYVNSSYIF